jgi:alpha-mannosidase
MNSAKIIRELRAEGVETAMYWSATRGFRNHVQAVLCELGIQVFYTGKVRLPVP